MFVPSTTFSGGDGDDDGDVVVVVDDDVLELVYCTPHYLMFPSICSIQWVLFC